MVRSLLLVLVFLKTFSVLADSFPIDDEGNILAPYLSLKLEEHQKNGLRIQRMVVLTPEQFSIINKEGFPKHLEIEGTHYRGCTCGSIYGIWFSPDSIAILKKFLDLDYTDPLVYEMRAPDSELEWPYRNGIFISVTGTAFYQGDTVVLISIRNHAFVKKNNYLHVFLPPKKDNEFWHLVEAKLKEIKAILPKGIRIVIH